VASPTGARVAAHCDLNTQSCGLYRVKAHSSGFTSQVNRCETVPDLYVRCLLLSFAVPQVPSVRGPGAARARTLVSRAFILLVSIDRTQERW
jgi:hypothetical protein